MRHWAQVPQLLVLVFIAAVAGQGGNETTQSGCEKAAYKAAPFMNKPVSAESLDKLLGPLWWTMNGNPLGSYDLSSLRPDLMAYLKEYSIEPIAGVLALFCLVLLSMLIFLLWRFLRCLCVVCCQQEAYADASKVLFSKRLRTWKGIMVIAGLAGCGIGAWGMFSLNRDLPAAVNAEIDVVQQFPQRLMLLVDGLADQADGLKQPLDSFTDIILNKVNISGMLADVDAIAYFLANAPAPAELKEILADVDASLHSALLSALNALQAEIDGSPSSGLQQLQGHITVLTAFNTSGMAATIDEYDRALQTVLNKAPPPASAADPDFQALVSAHAAVMGNLSIWLTSINETRAAVLAIDGMRTNPSTNPFSALLARLDAVNATAQDIASNKLANLSSTIDRFNQLWWANHTGDAFRGLIDKAVYANSSVMTLSDDILGKVNTINASVAQIDQLYQGEDNLLYMPANISAKADNLTRMPNDTDALRSKLQQAETQLNGAGGEIADTVQRLDNLSSLLDGPFRAAVDAIGLAIAAFEGGGSWAAFSAAAQGPAAVVSGVSAQMVGFSSMGSFVATATDIQTKIDDLTPNLAQQVSSIDDAKATINELTFASFSSDLNNADAAYSALGPSPAQLLDPIRSLLGQIQGIADDQLSAASTMVTTVSGSIRNVSRLIQRAAIDGVDSMQEKFLPANVTDSKQLNAVNAARWMHIGLLSAYGLVMFLVLLLFLMTLRNCPAGVCLVGFLLQLVLIFFALLPVLYTVFLLLVRDTCANVESVAVKAISIKMGPNSTASRVSDFYLGNGSLQDGSGGGLTSLLRGINADFDVDAVKAKVNQTVDGVLLGMADQNITLAPPTAAIMADAQSRIQLVMAAVDSIITGLDYPSVSAVYHQFKGWICCDLADQLFVQWAACLVLLALAWVALQCALAVLRNLDGLSDHCCGCSCYNARDYQAAADAPKLTKRLSSLLGGNNSSGSETVAVVNIGGLFGPKAANKYELPDSTPLPAPLHVMTSPPSAPVIGSPRMYPSIAGPAAYGGAPMAPADLQSQRAALFSVGSPQMPMYPNVAPPPLSGGMYGGYGQQQQQQQQQQQGMYWGAGLPQGRASPVNRM